MHVHSHMKGWNAPDIHAVLHSQTAALVNDQSQADQRYRRTHMRIGPFSSPVSAPLCSHVRPSFTADLQTLNYLSSGRPPTGLSAQGRHCSSKADLCENLALGTGSVLWGTVARYPPAPVLTKLYGGVVGAWWYMIEDMETEARSTSALVLLQYPFRAREAGTPRWTATGIKPA